MTNHPCWESVPKVFLLVAHDFTKAQKHDESQGFSSLEEIDIVIDLSDVRALLIKAAEPVY